MADDPVLLIESPVGLLALTQSAVAEARRKAAALTGDLLPSRTPNAAPAHAPTLVDAEEMGRLTGSTGSWWKAAARNGDAPVTYVGKVMRFDPMKAMTWLESIQERDGVGRVRRCAFAPRAGE